MKYDNCVIVESESRPNDNIVRVTKKKKVDILDVFIVQSIVCVLVSVGVMISRLI